ncbi:Uncharacterised protein [Vibrio cholerae]|nr:Uncharacterised protein [Vibrio cholerae]
MVLTKLYSNMVQRVMALKLLIFGVLVLTMHEEPRHLMMRQVSVY